MSSSFYYILASGPGNLQRISIWTPYLIHFRLLFPMSIYIPPPHTHTLLCFFKFVLVLLPPSRDVLFLFGTQLLLVLFPLNLYYPTERLNSQYYVTNFTNQCFNLGDSLYWLFQGSILYTFLLVWARSFWIVALALNYN